MTATVFSPFLIEPDSTAETKASSESNVRAFPVNPRPSLPVILATAPPGAKLPRRILVSLEKSRGTEGRRDEPDVSSSFNWLVERTDHVLTRGEFAMFVYPTLQVFAESSTSDRDIISVDEVIFHQEVKYLCS